MKEKIYNTIYGAIVADALGVPVEFKDRDYLKKNPVTDMIGYGTYNLPKGSWSDDSSMMLCLADSIGKTEGIDYEDIMKRFWDWYKHSKYTPDHNTFDIGRTCHAALVNFHNQKDPLDCGLKDERDNGNGSLMRIAPLPLYLYQIYSNKTMDLEISYEYIHNVSSLTHAHSVSLIGCDIYCAVMLEIYNGTNKEDLLKIALPKIGKYVKEHPEYEAALIKYDRIFHQSFKDIPENEIKSSGYIVDTLEAALWCFLNTNNYRDCVLKAVNLGSDTDTVACVAGSIAGLYYGNIPQEWIDSLRNKKLVDKIVESFTHVCHRISYIESQCAGGAVFYNEDGTVFRDTRHIMKIYLDMDGTLVDFVSQVTKYDFWRTDKENKVDWKKVKAMGPRFWSEMDWMPGAEEAFTKLRELESQKKLALYILSSIDFEDGRIGKTDWIKEKTNFQLEKVIFCLEPEDKAKWADKNSWLIDDRKKSLEPFSAAGGNIIEFTGDWKQIIKQIKSLIR
jgi:ADP-ribosylglycohydrolase